ncbi:hypothetical protein MO867_17465 [Microbulbifer sp. OS29]|uniref:Uncharacterized protein n=1 Tax=Microbulbifer okhotskensis TaxID=2926617 RepID=A0A9X2EV71_9GAMM|nr:hypothetical protein [Microbulbifer okhotskensis]MCO1336123.1 hypothetical protein [Microbulbifer okhotskensis]
MSQAITCPNGITTNVDGTVSCDAWVLVDLPAHDPIHDLTPEQLSDMAASIFLVCALAWGLRLLVNQILNSGFGRGNH